MRAYTRARAWRAPCGAVWQLCMCSHSFHAWQALMTTSPELRHTWRPAVSSSRSMNYIESARNRSIPAGSATPSLPTRDCRMRPDLFVPSRTSSSKVYLALSFLTRTSNLYLHGVRTCAGCGGAYPSESRLVMGEEFTAASLLHRFAYRTDASGMQRPCCTVAPPSHMPCNGRMRVYRQKTSPPCRRELL